MLPAAWDDFKTMTWSSAGQAVRAFVDQKRMALEKWRVGSERPDALYLQPEQMAMNQPIPLTRDMLEWFKLGYLYCVQPDIVQFLRESNRPVPPLPGGELGPLDQMASLASVRGPARMAWLRTSNGVERSRRAVRLLYTNWLAQVDRPATKQAPVAVREPLWIYAGDSAASPAASAVSPEGLAKAIERDEIAKTLLFQFLDRSKDPMLAPWELNSELARERRRRSALIVRLAAEWYRRERGQLPPTAGALLGIYLKELPEGIAANDPIPAGLE
jgi:hypothetical protein